MLSLYWLPIFWLDPDLLSLEIVEEDWSMDYDWLPDNEPVPPKLPPAPPGAWLISEPVVVPVLL
jgi:hypothetical protein